MLDIKQLQKEVVENKKNHGFNTSDINKEFCFLYGEVSESYNAFLKEKPDFGEELADVAIYLLGIAELTGVDLESEILQKVEKNKNRTYKKCGDAFVKEGENV